MIYGQKEYIRVCNEYKYLGVIFTTQGTIDKDILYKVDKAGR